MEIDGEGGGGEAGRRGRSKLRRLLEAIESSEVVEKTIPLIKQLEGSSPFSADEVGLILQGLLASWIDSTCSGVSHCTLHKSILQVALKCSDLDITDHLRQFLILGAKASSWCGEHLQWSIKSNDESQVVQEEEHDKLFLEINSLSFILLTKLFGIAAKCFTVLGLEVAAGEGGHGAAQEKCVSNKADDFPTLETMAVEVEPAPAHLTVGATPWSLAPVLSPPTRKALRRCTNCESEKTPRWLRGPDGPGTLCNACGQRFKKVGRLQSNSHSHSSSIDNSGAGNDLVVALVEALPCGVDASLDAFFDEMGMEVSLEEAGALRAEEEEELEWLSNKDAFPSVETMASEVEEVPALDSLPMAARTKGRQQVKAMDTWRQANVPPAEKETVVSSVLPRRRCTHCATEKTPAWRVGPEGAHTLCNPCGLVFVTKGRLLPEYRPANSPAFSPQLHSNRYSRALEMHCRKENLATSEMQVELMDPPEKGPTSPPLQRYSCLRHVDERRQSKEETSATGGVTPADAGRGEESIEVQLLPERRPAGSHSSLVSHGCVLKPSRKSEVDTLAAIRATAKARRVAAFLTGMV